MPINNQKDENTLDKVKRQIAVDLSVLIFSHKIYTTN